MNAKRIFATVIAFAALTSVANAHIVLAEPEAPANSYYAGFFRVSHGCENSPTVAIRIEIPAGIMMAHPQPKPGWRLSIEHETLTAPIQTEYGPITERVSAIIWRGRLNADEFDQFGVMMKLPDQTGPLYFRTVQTCARGERRWGDIPAPGQAWHAVESPAPVLLLTAPQHMHAH